MLYIHIGVASIRQIQCEQIEYVTEKKTRITILECTLLVFSSKSIVYVSVQHVRLSIVIKTPVTL